MTKGLEIMERGVCIAKDSGIRSGLIVNSRSKVPSLRGTTLLVFRELRKLEAELVCCKGFLQTICGQSLGNKAKKAKATASSGRASEH